MFPVTVIIPAYKPDRKLLDTLSALIEVGFSDLLVVDDGSGEEYSAVFTQVAAIPQCTLLRHPANRGKGAALKTAMTFFLDNRPEQSGVVTADADGQHLAKDILAVASAMKESGNIVLGVRNFSDPAVPAHNKAGNRITVAVFRLFFGMKLRDTQTGLRAFPRALLPAIASAKGDRYEFETEMLFVMKKRRLSFDEVDISAVYIEDNQSSHFRLVRDSIRIYSLILKYLFSSVGATVIDESAFFLLKSLFGPAALLGLIPTTFIAAFFARVISSLINYLVNAKVVFEGKANKQTLLRYYILAAAQIIISASVVFLLEHLLSISSPFLSTLIKTIVDIVLFFFSFRFQHIWVFNDVNFSGERTSVS